MVDCFFFISNVVLIAYKGVPAKKTKNDGGRKK